VDNLENQVATNHIGPFLLTKLLTPKILAARTELYTPRVVFISSIGHGMGTGVNFETLGRPDPTLYTPKDAYYQSKAANVLSAIELSKRSKGQIKSYSLHPGGIPFLSISCTVTGTELRSAIFTNIMQKEEGVTQMQEFGAFSFPSLG
jgi:NAD(P)-dependent dehydrogenase (short-subunit alcohol dehydrogenase family)